MKDFEPVVKVKNKIKKEFEMNSWWCGIAIKHNKYDGYFVVVQVSSDVPRQQFDNRIRDFKGEVMVVVETGWRV